MLPIVMLIIASIEGSLLYETWEFAGNVRGLFEILILLALPLSIMCLCLLKPTWRRRALLSMICVSVLVSAFKSYQLLQAKDTIAEAHEIVAHLNDIAATKATFPAELAPTIQLSSKFSKHFQRYETDGKSFRLFFFVTYPSISHWYDSSSGWGFADD